MAVTLNGTPVAWTSGNVTIPADTTAVYVFWTYWRNATGFAISSVTLGGNAPDQEHELTGTDAYSATGVCAWYSGGQLPGTGAQALNITWDGAPAEGPTTIVAFVKGGNLTSWRDVGSDQSNSTNAVTTTIDSNATDLVLKYDQHYSFDAPDTSVGWTSQQTHSNGTETGKLSSCDSPGAATTVCDSENENYSTIVAISIPAAGGGSNTLTAAQGSAAITGQAAKLLWHQKIKAEQGAAAITGQAAKLLWHQKIKAEQGAAAITGQAAKLNWHQKIKAEQGSAAITGQAARLNWHHNLKAEQGSAAITGQAARTQWHHSLKAEQAAVAISGQDATLTYTPAAVVRTLTAEQGSVAITGQAARLNWHHNLKAEQGAVAITGQAARLQWHHALKAEQGAVAITGQDAALKYTGVYTMNADHAGVAITGQAARLQKTWSLKCNHAQTTAYVSIGVDIPGLPLDRLYWHQAIKAVQGSAAITGQTARLQWHHKVKAEQASVAISAQAAPLTWNRLLKAEAAALAITGNDVDFYASRLLRGEQGAVAITGQDATLTYSGAPVLVAPAERTCKVGAESRVMIIEAENRTIVVPAEARHVDI